MRENETGDAGAFLEESPQPPKNFVGGLWQ